MHAGMVKSAAGVVVVLSAATGELQSLMTCGVYAKQQQGFGTHMRPATAVELAMAVLLVSVMCLYPCCSMHHVMQRERNITGCSTLIKSKSQAI